MRNRYNEGDYQGLSPPSLTHSFQSSHSLSPYGIQFGEEEKVRKLEQQRYKEDLDYLCSLRLQKKEIDDYSSRSKQIQFMNDKYHYDKLNQQSVIKNLNDYNYQTALNKQRERSEKKKELYDEFIQSQNLSKRQEEIEKELTQMRKAKMLQDLEDDLHSYHYKKEQEAKAKRDEMMKNQSLLNEETYRFHSPYQQYRKKIDSMNRRIYDRSKQYNGYFNSPVNNEFFNAKNDFEFNRKVAEQKEKEKQEMRMDPTKVTQRYEEMRRLKDEDDCLKEKKMRSQNDYKEYLDSQNSEKNNRANEQRKQSPGEQLIMPSYNYPNYPMPVTKKAHDPLQVSHTQPPLYEDKNRYLLGESQLRHNPITCPIDDIEYNKYVLSDLAHMNYSLSSNPTHNKVNHLLADTGNRIMSSSSQ